MEKQIVFIIFGVLLSYTISAPIDNDGEEAPSYHLFQVGWDMTTDPTGVPNGELLKELTGRLIYDDKNGMIKVEFNWPNGTQGNTEIVDLYVMHEDKPHLITKSINSTGEHMLKRPSFLIAKPKNHPEWHKEMWLCYYFKSLCVPGQSD